jgi:hypothetical protein
MILSENLFVMKLFRNKSSIHQSEQFFMCCKTVSVVWLLACWPLVPEFPGSNPAEAVGILTSVKILSMPSFGGEVKESVPCPSFAACKRS